MRRGGCPWFVVALHMFCYREHRSPLILFEPLIVPLRHVVFLTARNIPKLSRQFSGFLIFHASCSEYSVASVSCRSSEAGL